MRAKRYLGGMHRPGNSSSRAGDANWTVRSPNGWLYLEQTGFEFHAEAADGLAILIRGRASMSSAVRSIAETICRHYRNHGSLPVDDLEGSFTLILLDGRAGRLLLYRSLAGNGFTYYTEGPHGFRFGSNLAELVETSDTVRQPNVDVLPAFFLYRFVPGRETLFQGCYRLMPGELVRYDAAGLRRSQVQTFADLAGSHRPGADPVEDIEETFARVLGEQGASDPGTVNLLSGGVDSSYLQAVWNRTPGGRQSHSYSVSVDHPRTRPDSEYALSMANALGTRHTLVPTNGPYADYLIDSIVATGEPPNHVFAAYFGHLARVMAGRGIATALCGEGADSLFGIGAADELRKAKRLRSLVPFGFLRRGGRRWATAAGRQRLAYYFGLAERLFDFEDPEHPVNQVAAFTDWPSVEACFGKPAVRAACAYRRDLTRLCQVPADPMHLLHACGYLGEAVDSASLWTTLCNRAGVDLACPFLDSRVLRLALSLPDRLRFPPGQPKGLLKQALTRHVPAELVYRKKLGFGQPIFEWLAPGGQLRPWAEQIGDYDFVRPAVRAAALARPNWFLYSLLCYDLWHKLFIERSIPRPDPASPPIHHSTAATSCG